MNWWQRFLQHRQRGGQRQAQALAIHDQMAEFTRALTAMGGLEIPDGFIIRFEVMMWLVSRQLHQWNHRLDDRDSLGARLWEATCEGLDASLRRRGVSDLRIASRMKRLLRHASGRLNAYRQALANPDPMALRQVIARNVLDGAEVSDPRIDWLLAQSARVAQLGRGRIND